MAARADGLLVRRLATLRSDVARLAAADPRRRRPDLIADAFEKIDTAIEELTVLEEELRPQNQELAEVQATLETERARYRDLFDLAPDAYLVTDPDGSVREANRAAAELLNIPQHLLARLPLGTAITPESRRSFRTALVSQLASDEIGEWEGRLRPRRRPPLDVAVRLAALRDAEGRPVALGWLVRDISERKRAAEAQARLHTLAEQAEAKVRGLLEAAPDAIVIARPTGTIELVNSQVEELFGYRRAELLGQPVELLIPDRFHNRHVAHLSAYAANPRTRAMGSGLELYARHKDGREIPVEISLSALGSESGLLIISAIRDVTDRKQAERAAAADLAGMVRLQDVSTRLVQVDDMPSLLQAILDAAVAVSEADMGSVQLLDHESGALKIVASANFDAPFLDFFDTVQDGLAACGTALRRRERVIVEDVATSPIFGATPARDVMLGADARAVQSTPLISRGGHVVGMLSTHYRTPRRPTERQLRLIDLLARQATDCIERMRIEAERARLLDAEQATRALAEATAARLQSVLDISDAALLHLALDDLLRELLARISDAVNADIATIFFLDEASNSLIGRAGYGLVDEARPPVRIPMGQGIVGRVAAEGRALASGDQATQITSPALQRLGVRSALAAPLLIDGRCTGVVRVATVLDRQFSDYDTRLLELVAERAALGIERARLYGAVQAAESRYRGLFEGTADAVLVIDAAGHFRDANPPVFSLLGYSREELLSLSIGDILAPGQDWAETIFARSRREERWQAEIELRRKGGTTVPVEVRTRIVLLPDGAAYIAAVRDISERRALERLREEFVAMVTHELRSPLAAIDAYSQAGLRFGVPPEKALEVIRTQARQLDRMIRDLLDASRLAVGRMEIQCARMDLIELARQCADQAQTLSEAHRISLEAPEGPVIGHWDGGRLAQVLTNLLTNAIKYSPDGGDVVICVEPGDDQVRVSVSDQGIGIAAEALPHVFERFRRAEAVRSGDIEGLGLGLYICSSLVEAHGGRIEVASRVGRGTAFTVSLPYSLPAGPARHADPATQSPNDPAAEQAATGSTILLVEDDPSIVAPLQIALELGGYRVLTAADGAEALAFARTERPDVTVLDLSVPGLDPAEFSRALKSEPRPGPRIVIASGDPRAGEVAARLGADASLPKPFDLPTFLATMKRLATP